MSIQQVTVESAGEGVDLLLERIERGEELLITRAGRPVALLRSVAIDDAKLGVLGLLDLRLQLQGEGVAPFSPAEIRSLIDEGRKH